MRLARLTVMDLQTGYLLCPEPTASRFFFGLSLGVTEQNDQVAESESYTHRQPVESDTD